MTNVLRNAQNEFEGKSWLKEMYLIKVVLPRQLICEKSKLFWNNKELKFIGYEDMVKLLLAKYTFSPSQYLLMLKLLFSYTSCIQLLKILH